MTDDLISRQAAIEALNEVSEHYTEKGREWHPHVNFMTLAIYELPSAQQWIPVSERLPKLGEKVLVSTKNTVFTQVFKCIHGTPDRWGWEHNSIKKVIAWMPLPEPYKKEKKDAGSKI